MAERIETQRESRTHLGAGVDRCPLTKYFHSLGEFVFIEIFSRSDVVDVGPRGSQTARIYRPRLSGEFSPLLVFTVMIQLIGNAV